MACFHPLPAWRTEAGQVLLTKEPPRSEFTSLRLPCSKCLGCRMANAKAWALRCQLELQQHDAAVFTTLTYDEHTRPPTLDYDHVQRWLKRLRKSLGPNRTLRFFASGEYGERFTKRPHYHALLFGISEAERDRIEATWQHGLTHTKPVTPERISYTAGYTQKKVGYDYSVRAEQVDPETGEVYTWQPPFIQMSRRPGIGGEARQWTNSWRLFAIHNGQKMAVPRFLHEAWKAQATDQQLEELIDEKAQLALTRDTTPEHLEAKEKNAQARQARAAESRKY